MLKSKINFKNLEKKLIPDNLPLIGNAIIKDIIKRTQRGLSVELMPFKKYSKEYMLYRSEKGRSVKPNLTFTQNMLNSINYKKIPNGIRLFFNSVRENEKALKNNKVRHFFGVDRNLAKKIKRHLSYKK